MVEIIETIKILVIFLAIFSPLLVFGTKWGRENKYSEEWGKAWFPAVVCFIPALLIAVCITDSPSMYLAIVTWFSEFLIIFFIFCFFSWLKKR